MFDKEKYSSILLKIVKSYNSATEFAEISKLDRAYISRYIHMSIDRPPNPTYLRKLADNSNGIATYEYLMEICGHIKEKSEEEIIDEIYNKSKSTAILKDGYTEISENDEKLIKQFIAVVLANKKK